MVRFKYKSNAMHLWIVVLCDKLSLAMFHKKYTQAVILNAKLIFFW